MAASVLSVILSVCWGWCFNARSKLDMRVAKHARTNGCLLLKCEDWWQRSNGCIIWLRLLFYLSHTQLHREYIASSEMYSLHLTHPKWTHTRSSGQPCYSARGAVGGSVPCSRTPQSWYWRRILPPPTIPAGPQIRTHNLPLTSPTRYPLGHDCPPCSPLA